MTASYKTSSVYYPNISDKVKKFYYIDLECQSYKPSTFCHCLSCKKNNICPSNGPYPIYLFGVNLLTLF
jgi:hypothetical protein